MIGMLTDRDIDRVARNISQLQKRRLPVVDKQKRLVGVVSLANIASVNTDKLSANFIEGRGERALTKPTLFECWGDVRHEPSDPMFEVTSPQITSQCSYKPFLKVPFLPMRHCLYIVYGRSDYPVWMRREQVLWPFSG